MVVVCVEKESGEKDRQKQKQSLVAALDCETRQNANGSLDETTGAVVAVARVFPIQLNCCRQRDIHNESSWMEMKRVDVLIANTYALCEKA